MAISDLEGKYHCKLDGNGFIIARSRSNRSLYEKKPAPAFVSKFGSGDSSYRDATFWQFWAQLNWRNGAKQERFDDTSKFWKSENVNVSQVERISLSKDLASAGQIVAGETSKTSVAWRDSQTWWDGNYDYRKQITITAPDDDQIPEGYPIVITEDTAALETAGKLLANRNDWRVLYWNGTSWTDLTRHYVSATRTVFGAQAAIPAEGSSNAYYLYYGYSSAGDNKQPTDDDGWNEVYVPEDIDSPLVLAHAKEGTGNTVENTASGKTNNGSLNTVGWTSSNTKFGFALDFSGTEAKDMTFAYAAGMNVDYFTFDTFLKSDVSSPTGTFARQQQPTGKWDASFAAGRIKVILWGASGQVDKTTASAVISDTNWHHIAIVFNGTFSVKIYKDGDLHEDLNFSGTHGQTFLNSGNEDLDVGFGFNGKMSNIRFMDAIVTSFPHAFSAAVGVSIGGEEETQPPASNFTLLTGVSDGTIHQWGGGTSWTEAFDCRRLTWFDDTDDQDADEPIGDVGGTEYAQGQSFELATAQTVKAIEMYLKINAGTPGDISVRIETNATNKPSGSLAHANATATITTEDVGNEYAWTEAVFAETFVLSATTTYWIVLLVAAGDNDQNYHWGSDASTPSYGNGTMAQSTDGGSAWSAVTGADALFRVKSLATDIYCSLVSSIGGTQKAWWGVGDTANETDGDARLYTYDGSTWALAKTFTDGTSCAVTALEEFNDKIYAATAPQAYILSTDDASSWTESTQIRIPQNPGFIYTMQEYNQRLYVGGGSPEFLPDEKYNGFVYYHDGVSWDSLYPFDHTVVTCMGYYDAFLFIGTYHGQVYIFDTATLDPLITFADDFDFQVQIRDFMYFDDKMYIALFPQDDTGDTSSALWMFERHGISAINAIPSGLSITGIEHMVQVNNTLMIGTDNGYMFQLDFDNYEASGTLETSYFDAILPSITKLYNELQLEHDPMPTGTSITVSYRFREGDSWIELGSASEPGETSTTITFPTGITSKKVALKYTLATTDSSKTPVVRESVLKYTLDPTRKWQWNLRLIVKGKTTKDKIILLDKSQDSRTAAALRGQIEDALASNQLIQFFDIDGTEYTVLFHTLDEESWVIDNDSSDLNENSIAITLLEA